MRCRCSRVGSCMGCRLCWRDFAAILYPLHVAAEDTFVQGNSRENKSPKRTPTSKATGVGIRRSWPTTPAALVFLDLPVIAQSTREELGAQVFGG